MSLSPHCEVEYSETLSQTITALVTWSLNLTRLPVADCESEAAWALLALAKSDRCGSVAWLCSGLWQPLNPQPLLYWCLGVGHCFPVVANEFASDGFYYLLLAPLVYLGLLGVGCFFSFMIL